MIDLLAKIMAFIFILMIFGFATYETLSGSVKECIEEREIHFRETGALTVPVATKEKNADYSKIVCVRGKNYFWKEIDFYDKYHIGDNQ